MALRGEESNFVSCGRSRRDRVALILRLEPEDLGVAFHVHEAVAAHVEGDDLGLAGLLHFSASSIAQAMLYALSGAGKNPSVWTN